MRAAAAALGPNAGMPASPSLSTRPSTSGASGPTTTRSARQSRRPRGRAPAHRSASAGRHSTPSRAIPALPGAAATRGRCGLRRERAHERVLAPAAADYENAWGHYRAAMKSSIGMAVSVS